MADPKKPEVVDVAALQTQVSALQDQIANLQKTIAVERPVALPARIAQEREEAFEAMQAELGKSCSQRTQEAAEKLWGADTKTRYVVKVADQPELKIPARSPEEAKGRYDKICGIRTIDADKHQYRIVQANAA
jgi:hypothetical protein